MSERAESGARRFGFRALSNYAIIPLVVTALVTLTLSVTDTGSMAFKVVLGIGVFAVTSCILAVFAWIAGRRRSPNPENSPGGRSSQSSRVLPDKVDEPETGKDVHSPIGQGAGNSSPDTLPLYAWTSRPSISTTSAVPPLAAQTHSEGPVRIWAASRVGARHLRLGEKRQDAFGTRITEGLYLAVVADGVGSTPDADRAANSAVEAALRQMPGLPVARSVTEAQKQWSALTRNFVNAIQLSMNGLNRRQSHPSEVPSTTIVVSILKLVSSDVAWAYWLSVGDSAIVRIGPDRQDFEHMNNAPLSGDEGTDALPEGRHRLRIESGVFVLRRGEYCILATDGVWKLLYKDPGYFMRGFSRIISDNSDASHLLALIESDTPGLDDDATAVLMNFAGAEEL